MLDWFLALSPIGKAWTVYGLLSVVAFAVAAYFEITAARKVNGAGGWLLFAALMLVGAYGLPLMLLLTGLIWLVNWLL